MKLHHGSDNLFAGFKFTDIRDANPPNAKGVYVIRVRKEGRDTTKVIAQITKHVSQLNWPVVGNYLLNRIDRLKNINDCPIIYIGSAGTRRSSKHTLKGRYKDFSGRHTVMYPIWALLYSGWELEYGWKVSETPNQTEQELKVGYRSKHLDILPALTER